MAENSNHPRIKLKHLDHLWFQVTGTLCNLACTHCFNNSGPGVRTFDFLSPASIAMELQQAVRLGVKEIFFTGGEPFLHKELIEILALSLQHAPTTVLTNGTLINDRLASQLGEIEKASRYSLEIRMSLDGYTEEMNDRLRGPGVFNKVLEATVRLTRWGLLPLVTIVRTWTESEELAVIAGFINTLRQAGYSRPRIKILPSLPLGRELTRMETDHHETLLTEEMLRGFDSDLLMCSNSRIVTSRGVWVCPLLVEEPDARLGNSMDAMLPDYELRHRACHTCYQYGTFCQNVSASVEGTAHIE
ncbi:MAG TPA: radical SAM protein [Candidatus Angelobacter sp.]|nr:radical SAM protein [Candidatus Angelobacter sp.]